MPAAAIRKRGSDSQRGAASTRLLIREAVADGVGTDKLEHLPIGVFETDASGACRYVNARMCEFLGMSSVAALGYGWTSAVHPEDRDRVTSAWHDAVRDGQELAIEFRFQRPDGTVTWVAASVAGISGSVASGSGYVGTVTDITLAVEARQQLINERHYVDTVLDLAGSLVCVLDPDGRILRFNHACEVVTGYAFKEVQGRPFYDFLVPEHEIEDVKVALSQIRPGEPPAASENHWLTRDGELRLIRWLDACFFDDAGALTHIVSTGLDITEERRAEEALHGMEAIATLLATTGPTPETLAAVLEKLSERMGYRYLALFLVDEKRLQLGAQLGYDPLPTTFDPDAGIVGRVLRAGRATLVADVATDPDYIEGHPDVVSEIAVPLAAEGRPLGVLSIGGTTTEPLTMVDLRLAEMVGERLSMALVVGREQQLLAHRARLFGALNDFARTANSIPDEETLVPALLDAIAEIVAVDGLGLTVLDRETGRYVLQAMRGTGIVPARAGAEVRSGKGAVGRAIADRTLVVDRQRASASGSVIRIAVPLIHDEIVLGALSVARTGTDEPGFTELEREVLTLVALQAALALANAHLLAEVRALAIRDALTGLYNRRHFDASLQLILARWARDRDRDLQRPVAAILFDLDHFGQFNKDYGHQAGDAVLRAFGGILLTRFRSADLVARYGGEEFVAILDGATRDEAMAVAEEIRAQLESRAITGPDDQPLRATVSAGCAALDATEPTREALLGTADTGLAMAKRSGRNRVIAA